MSVTSAAAAAAPGVPTRTVVLKRRRSDDDEDGVNAPPVLRLRPAGRSIGDLERALAEHSGDAVRRLDVLCRYADVPAVLARHTLIELLFRCLAAETDVDCKRKMVQMLCAVGAEAAVWADAVLGRLHGELKRLSLAAAAGAVDELCALLQAVLVLVQRHPSTPVPAALDSSLARLLRHPSQRVRSLCLLLLAEFSEGNTRLMGEATYAIARFIVDPDPRVRKTALEALLLQATRTRGAVLKTDMYASVVSALRDDYEEVRMPAAKLLRLFAEAHAEFIVNSATGMRLIDDAFVKVCDRVNDSAVAVRTEACNQLGKFKGTTASLLEQTLSKQIMSHLSKRQSYQEEQRAKMGFDVAKASAEATAARMQGQAASDKDVSEDDINLLESGACGAFVHGLEDEFERVRLMSLGSLCRLSLHSEEFAAKAIDFVVDMFSDEIDEVRMCAIRALMLIGHRHQIRIRQDQLSIMMMLFHDYAPPIRIAVHDLMGSIRVSDLNCLNLVVNELLANLSRYPDDQQSILRTLASVGRNHAHLCEFLVKQLLKIDDRFLTTERSLSDPSYHAVLVLLLNAAAHNNNICPLLPKHVFRHFLFLRRSHPQLFESGALKFWRYTTSMSIMDDALERDVAQTEAATTDDKNEGGEMFRMVVDRLQQLQQMGQTQRLHEAQVLTHQTRKDLDYLRRMSRYFEGPSAWLEIFLECTDIIIQVRQQLVSQRGDPHFLAKTHTLTGNLTKLLHGFSQSGVSSLSEAILASVQQLQVVALVLEIVADLTGESLESDVSVNDRVKRFFERLQTVRGPASEALLSTTSSNSNSNADALLARLLDYLSNVWPSNVPVAGDLLSLTRQSAVIESPVPNPEKPISFIASMVLELPLHVSVSNVADLSSLAVQLRLPDQSVQLFWPNASQFKRVVNSGSHGVSSDDELDDALAGRIAFNINDQVEGRTSTATTHNDSSQTSHQLTIPVHLLNASWTDASDIAIDVLHVFNEGRQHISLLSKPVVFTVAPKM